MNELTTVPHELSANLKIGMVLTRKQTARLLKTLSEIQTEIAGCLFMQAQLRAMLAQKNWMKISIGAGSADELKTTGVTIGVVEYNGSSQPPRLSPMQKWQKKNGFVRR